MVEFEITGDEAHDRSLVAQIGIPILGGGDEKDENLDISAVQSLTRGSADRTSVGGCGPRELSWRRPSEWLVCTTAQYST